MCRRASRDPARLGALQQECDPLRSDSEKYVCRLAALCRRAGGVPAIRRDEPWFHRQPGPDVVQSGCLGLHGGQDRGRHLGGNSNAERARDPVTRGPTVREKAQQTTRTPRRQPPQLPRTSRLAPWAARRLNAAALHQPRPEVLAPACSAAYCMESTIQQPGFWPEGLALGNPANQKSGAMIDETDRM